MFMIVSLFIATPLSSYSYISLTRVAQVTHGFHYMSEFLKGKRFGRSNFFFCRKMKQNLFCDSKCICTLQHSLHRME